VDGTSPAEQLPLFDNAPYLRPPPLSARQQMRQNVQQVFDQWVQAANKTAATKLDAKREKLIKRALQQYPLEDVLAAVTGWRRSAFHTGGNDRNRVYNQLELLLRDAAHIEMFRDLEREHHRQNAPTRAVNIQQLQ